MPPHQLSFWLAVAVAALVDPAAGSRLGGTTAAAAATPSPGAGDGGGTAEPVCVSDSSWRDADGNGCSAYDAAPDLCSDAGDDPLYWHAVARCCGCGGTQQQPLDPPPTAFHYQITGAPWPELNGNYTLTDPLSKGTDTLANLVDGNHAYLELSGTPHQALKGKLRIFKFSENGPTNYQWARNRWVLYGPCKVSSASYKPACADQPLPPAAAEEQILYFTDYDIQVDKPGVGVWQHLAGLPDIETRSFLRVSPCDPALAVFDAKIGVCECKPGLTGPVTTEGWGNGCKQCEPGKFKPIAGTKYFPEYDPCELCEKGKFSQSPGAFECSGCQRGKFSEVFGASVCAYCPIGTYKSSVGAGNCTACGNGATSNVSAAVSKSACVCSAGFHGPSSAAECQAFRLTAQTQCESRGCCKWVAPPTSAPAPPSAPPPPPPYRRQSQDLPPEGHGAHRRLLSDNTTTECVSYDEWVDSVGENCGGYALNPDRCNDPDYAEAKIMCCACGGGKGGSYGCKTAIGDFPCDGCQACSPGTYKTSPGSAVCTDCEIGKMSKRMGNAQGCGKCHAGSFQNTTGNTFCYGCDGGHFTDRPGASACEKCPGANADPRSVSIFSVPDNTKCADACAAGFFSTPLLTCESCPTCQNNTDNNGTCIAKYPECGDIRMCWNYTSQPGSSEKSDCYPVKEVLPSQPSVSSSVSSVSGSVKVNGTLKEEEEEEEKSYGLTTNTIIIICIVIFSVILCRFMDGRRQVKA